MAAIVHFPGPRGAGLLDLPVGRPAAPCGHRLYVLDGDRLHVMDGDGASLCEDVDAADLIEVHELRWREVPISMRCRTCRALMLTFTADVG